jgi:hypothetical protein
MKAGPMERHVYGAAFMGVTSQSRRSAERVIGHMLAHIPVASVADFGCALGTWLSVWNAHGVEDYAGVDGDYLEGQPVEIAHDRLLFRNLAAPIELGRRFDLVESLEVAEHLPVQAAGTFIDTLTRHGDLVLFSAAPPGQGGEHHVNERPYGFWRDLFAERGYAMFDWVRPAMADDRSVRYWYRYNTFLFANEARAATLAPEIVATRVPEGDPVPDVSPVLFRLRKALVRRVPAAVQSSIARGLANLRTR